MNKLTRILATTAAAASIVVTGLSSASGASASTPKPPTRDCVATYRYVDIKVPAEHTYLRLNTTFQYHAKGAGYRKPQINLYGGITYVGKHSGKQSAITGHTYLQIDGGAWTSSHAFRVLPGHSYNGYRQSTRIPSTSTWGHRFRLVASLPGDGTYVTPWNTMATTSRSDCLLY